MVHTVSNRTVEPTRSTSTRRPRGIEVLMSISTAVAPPISNILPGSCGAALVRRPNVSHAMQLNVMSNQDTGDTPGSDGWRTMRTICGTTIATPRVAPVYPRPSANACELTAKPLNPDGD